MEVLISDDVVGLLQRAARCDGAHPAITLATRRVVLATGVTLDCCAVCLTLFTRMARVAGVPYTLEPTVETLAIGRHAACDPMPW